MGIPGPWVLLLTPQKLELRIQAGAGAGHLAALSAICCLPFMPCCAVTQPEQVAFLSCCKSLMLTPSSSSGSRDILIGLAHFLHPYSACLLVYGSSVLAPSSIPGPTSCGQWGRVKWCGHWAAPTIEPPGAPFLAGAVVRAALYGNRVWGVTLIMANPSVPQETMGPPSHGVCLWSSRRLNQAVCRD